MSMPAEYCDDPYASWYHRHHHPFNVFAEYFNDHTNTGTRTHIINSVTSLAMLSRLIVMSGRRSCSALSTSALLLGFVGLFYDNAINALGKYVGTGRTLRVLTKFRLLFHGVGVPFLMVPIVEASFFQGLIGGPTASKMLLTCGAFALYELVHWLWYDSNHLQVVDNRDSTEHSVRYLAGTLTYTSGKVLQCVLPAALLSLFQLSTGALLFRKSIAGVWLLLSGLVSFASCAVPKRPDVQLYGETVSTALLWAAAASMF